MSNKKTIASLEKNIAGLLISAGSMDKHNRILNERLNSSLRTSDALTEALEQCQDELDRERELHTRALEQADGLMVNNQILRKQLRERK